VTFTVDAYPDIRFTGKVTQIRNAPVITQNVVTYVVIVSVDNRDMKLKPGMTANVTVETARKDNVLKIPSAALRFKPAAGEMTDKGKQVKPADQVQRKAKKEPAEKVYVLGKDNKPVPVRVKTGLSNDGQVELEEGNLKEGDEVIVEQLNQKKTDTKTPTRMGPRF